MGEARRRGTREERVELAKARNKERARRKLEAKHAAIERHDQRQKERAEARQRIYERTGVEPPTEKRGGLSLTAAWLASGIAGLIRGK